MILSKKYMFETKSTRLKRFAINAIIVSFISITLLSGIFISIPIYANNQNTITQSFLLKESPDLIAVYTGDSGRIETAIELAKKYPSAKLFISGVYEKNSYLSLLNKQIKNQDHLIEDQKINAELDYKSKNTLENVLSTKRYLELSAKYKNIIIVSSDYHILRISLLESIVIEENKKINFYFHSNKTDFSNWKNLLKLFKESIKIVKTFGFYFMWND